MRLMIMAALALLAAAAASTVGDDNDTELVKQRLVAAMLPTPAGEPAAIKAAHTLAAALESNGTWPDIDYHEFRRAGWPMVAHLGRVRTMAATWRGASNATGALLSETKLEEVRDKGLSEEAREFAGAALLALSDKQLQEVEGQKHVMLSCE